MHLEYLKNKNMAEDKRKLSVLGTTSAQSSSPAIKAYLDAKAASSNIRSNWDVLSDVASDAVSGIDNARESIKIKEEARAAQLQSYEDEFTSNTNKITENAGSLGEEYYSKATEEAKRLQQEYMQAVKLGDKEKQQTLKMQLNGLSTGVQSLKESLSIAAELKGDEKLSNGRTDKEKNISRICTNPANIIYEEDGWKWRNPDFDGSPGSQEFYTQEDLDNSLGQINETEKLAFSEYRNTMNGIGMNYINGTGGSDFDSERIKVHIGDNFITQDNIMSVMHDDFRGVGQSHTFAADLSGHLEQLANESPDFYGSLGIDANGDGDVNSEDWDSVEDRKRIIDAITNKDSQVINPITGEVVKLYNYETSKNIVAGYLALDAKKKFYGKSDPSIKPTDGETADEFQQRGGIVGKYNGSNPNSGVVYKVVDGVGTFYNAKEMEDGKKLAGY